ncbi:MAG: transcriptional repressor LexA [Dissulfuribacterales bacterium]
MDLTPRQKSVLEFIRMCQKQTGIIPSVREICDHLCLSGPAGIHRILRLLEKKGHLVSTPGKKRSWRLPGGPPRKSIPVLGEIAAGIPIHAQENRDEELPVDSILFGSDDCFALLIRGDSMVEAYIADGDLAVIRPQDNADNGQIVAVMVDDILPEATLKVFHRKSTAVELHAANSRYPPLIFRGKEQGRVKILGRLAGVIRRGRS